jgi:RNA polymerase sigma-70 factor (ECF subfamily)
MERLDGQKIIKLISEMPAGFRAVFNLSVLDGFSHQEIAQQLGISEGASRSQLSRARVWLQERIKKMEK